MRGGADPEEVDVGLEAVSRSVRHVKNEKRRVVVVLQGRLEGLADSQFLCSGFAVGVDALLRVDFCSGQCVPGR